MPDLMNLEILEFRKDSLINVYRPGNFREGKLTVGQDAGNDIMVKSPFMLARHGRFVLEGGRPYYENLEGAARVLSAEACAEKKEARRFALEAGDVVVLDSPECSEGAIFVLVEGGRANVRMLAVSGDKRLDIGSDVRCAVRLENVGATEQHAQILRKGRGHELRPIDDVSVNGEMVKRRHPLRMFDIVAVGAAKLIWLKDMLIVYAPAARGMSVSVRKLSRTVREGRGALSTSKILLDDVSLDILPGEMVAIIGGSGAGKTTLLNAMSGYSRIPKDRVFIDGLDLYEHASRLKHLIGYVPQQDIVYESLTLESMLLYTAQLRMPAGSGLHAQRERVKEAIRIVQLNGMEGLLIQKMSGGQRKRASIAMELLANPSLLFLDEPTSGLDEHTEEELLKSLREIADTGKTVILVTHSTSFLDRYDKMIVMGKGGRLCYFGHADGINEHFKTKGIQAVYNMLSGDEAEKWRRIYDEKNVLGEAPRRKAGGERAEARGVSILGQLAILIRRYAALMLSRYKEEKFKAIWFLPLIFGGILGLIVGEDLYVEFPQTQTVSFIMACIGMWIGLFLGIAEISGERPIFRREAKANMKLGAYILSKVIVLSLISILQTALLFGLFYALTRFLGKNMPTEHLTALNPWIENWITVELVCLSSITLGLLISAFSKKPEGLAPYILMAQIILPGVLLSLPPLLDWAKRISCTYWGNRALCTSADVNELGAISAYKQVGDFLAGEVFKRRDDYIPELFNLLDSWKGLLALYVGPVILSLIGLKRIVLRDER